MDLHRPPHLHTGGQPPMLGHRRLQQTPGTQLVSMTTGSMTLKELVFDNREDKPQEAAFALRFRDWKLGPEPKQEPKKKSKKKKEPEDPVDLDMDRVKSFIGCAIMEEVGIKDSSYTDDGGDVREVAQSPDTRHQTMPTSQELRSSDLFTNYGGFPTVRWLGVGLKKLPDCYRLISHPASPFGLDFRRTTIFQSDTSMIKFTLSDSLAEVFTKRGLRSAPGFLSYLHVMEEVLSL
ncbi:hypothetical protein AUP68_10458 [Ilyonectria robusta]